MKTITKDEWNGFTLEKRRVFTGIIKYSNNIIEYLNNGITHREDGPAVIWPDGRKEYWINGKQLTKLEWLKQTPRFKDLMEYKKL